MFRQFKKSAVIIHDQNIADKSGYAKKNLLF